MYACFFPREMRCNSVNTVVLDPCGTLRIQDHKFRFAFSDPKKARDSPRQGIVILWLSGFKGFFEMQNEIKCFLEMKFTKFTNLFKFLAVL